MAAAGLGNPSGLVTISDFGNPSMLGGKARAESVSGGVFVFGSTATAVVNADISSFATSDLLFARDASGAQFNGIALFSAGSNTNLTVATQGVFILACNGSVFGGMKVVCDGNNAVSSQPYITGSPSSINNIGWSIGRAVTDGASGGYAVVHIGV